jgi:hypothetical protein
VNYRLGKFKDLTAKGAKEEKGAKEFKKEKRKENREPGIESRE